MPFLRGVESGKGVSNPFGILLREISKSEERRLAEDEKRRGEESELKKALALLSKKQEFDLELEREKGDIEIRKEGKPITKAMDQVGITGQTGQVGEMAQQPGQSVLRAAGLQPQGKVTTTSKGEEFFMPESQADKKNRLQIQKLEQDLDPEFQKQEFSRKLQEQEQLDEQSVKKTIETQRLKNKQTASTEMKEINNMVDSLWNEANTLLPAQESGREAVFKGAERGFKGTAMGRLIVPSEEGENVRAFTEARKALATPLIRSLGEKGMLTNQDVQRALNLMPTSSDTIKQRDTKKGILSRFLQSKVNAHFESIEFDQEAIASEALEKESQKTKTKAGNTFKVIE